MLCPRTCFSACLRACLSPGLTHKLSVHLIPAPRTSQIPWVLKCLVSTLVPVTKSRSFNSLAYCINKFEHAASIHWHKATSALYSGTKVELPDTIYQSIVEMSVRNRTQHLHPSTINISGTNLTDSTR